MQPVLNRLTCLPLRVCGRQPDLPPADDFAGPGIPADQVLRGEQQPLPWEGIQRRHIEWRGWQHRRRQSAVDRLWPAPDLGLTDHPDHRRAVISSGDTPLTRLDQLRVPTGPAARRTAQVILHTDTAQYPEGVKLLCPFAEQVTANLALTLMSDMPAVQNLHGHTVKHTQPPRRNCRTSSTRFLHSQAT